MKPSRNEVPRQGSRRPAKTARAIDFVLLCAALASSPAVGSATEIKPEKNLGDLSLEELMNETVTSVSKREEKLSDAAAAITVLSNDDIRRSGVTSVAEALRMVAGLEVAAVNASDWSISARSFSGLYANKLLVLVDGRAVYTPIFAGVFWDMQQSMLEDLDRIEVIRGPGATVWGANAVNGVINVVTRSARETQGTLIYGGGGGRQVMAGAREGGRINENTYYRVFGGYQATGDNPMANGSPAGDKWESWQGGFRVDQYSPRDTHLTWQGDAVSNIDRPAKAYNLNTLGRWTRELAPRSSVEFQAYYDRTSVNDPARLHAIVDTFDFTAQHTVGVTEHNDLIWGLGYRFAKTKLEQSNPTVFALIDRAEKRLFSAFAQDEYKVIPRQLWLTAGIKVEHNDYTGLEFQPSVRATYKPAENQTWWAAVSRAVRTPSEIEGTGEIGTVAGLPFLGPLGPRGGLFVPMVVGNDRAKSEVLWAYELGYRIQPTKRVSVDLAAFYNVYSDLINIDLSAPPVFTPGFPVGLAVLHWENIARGHTYGGEASVTFSPVDNLRLTSSYSLAHTNTSANGPATLSPLKQASFRSSYDFTKQWSLDAQVRYVGEVPIAYFGGLTFPALHSYVTGDFRLSWRPTDRIEVAAVGQNLFAPHHPEQSPGLPGSTTSETPRGFYAKFTRRF